MNRASVHLGFAVGTGATVEVPLRHLAITGQTQLAGKTTALEALVARSGRSAIAFKTKRGEGSFADARVIPPVFRERADWQFVASVLEATLHEKLKFERSWIMRACKGAFTLADVQRNVEELMKTAKGLSADVYLQLHHYLEIVVPQIAGLSIRTREAALLGSGLAVMDLTSYSTEVQALIIRSTIEWVHERATKTLVIVPEAWEFVPQNRGSPVLLAAEQLVRKGASLGNFLWLDSQDIAGVHKNILRQVGVWLLGVQRERNEVRRTLDHIPGGIKKPGIDDVMSLGVGEFYVCFDRVAVRAYAQPRWMDKSTASGVALGVLNRPTAPPTGFVTIDRPLTVDEVAELRRAHEAGTLQLEPAPVTNEEADALRAENNRLRQKIAELERRISDPPAPADIGGITGAISVNTARRAAGRSELPTTREVGDGPLDMDAIYAEVKRRAESDPGVLAMLTQKPELVVTVKRHVIQTDDSRVDGMLAILISEGFFDGGATGNSAFDELKRRGKSVAKPSVYRAADSLAEKGFLRKDSSGYRAVPDMKINIQEAA